MKSRSIVYASAVAASAFTLPVLAAQTPMKSHETNRPGAFYEHSRAAGTERLGKVSKASEVIAMEVKNLQNEKLGKVEDLGVDLESGHIVFPPADS